MKKILILGIILLTGFCTGIKAEEECKTTYIRTTFSNYKVDIKIGKDSRKTGYINSGIFTSNTSGASSVGFCVDLGKPISASGKDTYILDTSNSVRVTDTMRRAYTYMQRISSIAGTGSNEWKLVYMASQVAIWMERNNGGLNFNLLEAAIQDIFELHFCKGNTKNCNESQMAGAYARGLMGLNPSIKPTTENLCIYKSATSSGYQRFVAKCMVEVCKEIPPGDPVDPDEKPPCYPTVEASGSPAVCANDNMTHTGSFYQSVVYDPNNCGEASDDGEPERPIGDYCYLYCLEEVEQRYPGGIANPISLGTNIVWPTSVATEKTIWGNLYKLGYTGTKTCKIKIAPNSKQSDTVNTTFQNNAEIIRNYQKKYDYRGKYRAGVCENNLRSDLEQARQAITRAENDVNSKQAAYDEQVHQYNVSLARYNGCMADERSCNAGKVNCFMGCAGNMNCVQNCDKINCDKGCSQPGSARKDAAQVALNTAKTNLENAKRDYERIGYELHDCHDYTVAVNGANAILGELESCLNYSFSAEDLYTFESDTSIQYNDPEYGTTYPLTGTTSYECTNCTSESNIAAVGESIGDINNLYNQLKNTIENREIKITATATYTLPNDNTIYRYVNKKNNQPLKVPTGDYINVGYGFLPTSYNASTKKKYDLKIIVNSLGQGGKFTELANQNTYTCNYFLTNTGTDECVCPVGTMHAGEDLSSIIYNASISSTPMTCATAQMKYCGSENITENHVCPNDPSINITDCIKSGAGFRYCVETLCPGGAGDQFCPNDRSIKITGCLNSGNTYDFCVNTICNSPDGPDGPNDPDDPDDPDDDYHCPKGTWNDGMDIKPCVFANIGPNVSLQEALQYCKETVCPYKGGINIIYRTISLRNPFPGKTASVGKLITTRNFSLDNLKGRFPGSNWNSVELVKTQILNNRSVEADQVYTKEPLYSFVIDTNKMKNIRVYNQSREKNGGYSDFTLTCKNGVACLSSFIRDPQYGLVGGVCKDDSHNNFYSCSES